MKIALVLNRAGGSPKKMDADKVALAAAGRLGASGHSVDRFVLQPQEIGGRLSRYASDGEYDAVFAGGGDGTISAAAAALADSEVALGVPPLGTLNLFARSLGMPIDLDGAIDALASGSPRAVDLGAVNCIAFVNHVSLGLHPRVIRLRESAGYSPRETLPCNFHRDRPCTMRAVWPQSRYVQDSRYVKLTMREEQ